MKPRRHIGLPPEKRLKFLKPVVLGVLCLILLLFVSLKAVACVLVLIALNALLETNKRFLGLFPIDIEILYVGCVTLGATLGALPAISAALLGVAVAEYFSLRSSREIMTRTPSLVIASLLATAVPATFGYLLLAAGIGLLIHYLLAAFVYGVFGLENWMRRLTTLAITTYVLYGTDSLRAWLT